MMYSEFIEGTGCKENAHNFKVYQDLEIMYMNSDLSKAEIYEYGKKLVDNSKSEKEIEFENGIYEEIENHKRQIEQYKEWLKTDEDLLNRWKELEKSADQVAYSGEYEKAAGMYKVIRKLWKFLRDSEDN